MTNRIVIEHGRRRAVVALAASACAIAALLAGCGDDGGTNPSTPSSLSKVSGDSQTTAVNAATGAPLVARVLGGNGSALASAHMSWRITAGGGTLSDSASTTDGSGEGRVTYTAGTAAGVSTVSVGVGELAVVTFTVTVAAGPVKALAKFGIDSPAAVKSTPVTLTVKAGDEFGNGVTGAVVTWTASGGTLSGATSTSVAGGVATIVLTLSDQPGVFTVTATTPGAPPLTITITSI